MNSRKVLTTMGLALGLSALGCGAEGTSQEPDADGLPPLTAEQRVVTANMERGTLTEIDLPEGEMRFVETAPGQVMVLRQFQAGAKVTRVQGEDEMTLPQIFKAYAPGREVPQSLYAAAERIAQASLEAKEQPDKAATVAFATTPGEPIARPVRAAGPDGTESVTAALLASTVDPVWFVNNFCQFFGTDQQWCFPVAFQNAAGWRHSHRTGTITCGDTGSARTEFRVNGTLNNFVNVPYGQCFTMHYHGPHGLFGVNLERDLRTTVTVATGTVRFAGWFADEDQFLQAF